MVGASAGAPGDWPKSLVLQEPRQGGLGLASAVVSAICTRGCFVAPAAKREKSSLPLCSCGTEQGLELSRWLTGATTVAC
jgi:hypothetical protein